MPDVFTKEKRSLVMSRIRSKDTKPELKIRKALHALGFRYKLHDKSLPGKPDLVFPKYKTVIQVRGCFWHGHDCKVGHVPQSNQEYWLPKIAHNIERDMENDKKLASMGWKSIVIWECQCRKKILFDTTLSNICAKLRANYIQADKYCSSSLGELTKIC